MQRRDLGIGAAVVVAAVLMVTAGFEIGSRARARQTASTSEAPAAPAGTAAGDLGTAAGSGTSAGSGAPGDGWSTSGTGGPAGPGAAEPAVGALVPATGRLLAAPSVPLRIAAGTSTGLTCAQLQTRVTGLVPTACGRTSLGPSGRAVVWVSGRVSGSLALSLQVWSPAGDGTWEQSLVATEPRPARTWRAIRVATPALSAAGRTLVAQFRAHGSDEVLAYDLVSFPPGGAPVVVAHRDGLVRGTVRVTVTSTGATVLDDYSAGSETEPTAAPDSGSGVRDGIDHARIGLVADSFRYLALDRVAVPGEPLRATG